MQELQMVLIIGFITAIFYIATTSLAIQQYNINNVTGPAYNYMISQLVSGLLVLISAAVGIYFAPRAMALVSSL